MAEHYQPLERQVALPREKTQPRARDSHKPIAAARSGPDHDETDSTPAARDISGSESSQPHAGRQRQRTGPD